MRRSSYIHYFPIAIRFIIRSLGFGKTIWINFRHILPESSRVCNLCENIWPAAANPNTTSGYLANSNTTRGEVLTKWIGFTEVARSHHQHRNGYRVCVIWGNTGLLDMCPCVWIGLCPNMYLPRTGVYPPRAHILDPWGRAILHAPTHTLGWMYTPISTLGSLGMGVEWGLPH